MKLPNIMSVSIKITELPGLNEGLLIRASLTPFDPTM